MSNDSGGYRPSAGERLAQDFAARKLGEVLNGRGTTVPVDWDRLVGSLGLGAGGGDSDRELAKMNGIEWLIEMNRKLFQPDDPNRVFMEWLYSNIDDLPGAAAKLGIHCEAGPNFVDRLKAAVLPVLLRGRGNG